MVFFFFILALILSMGALAGCSPFKVYQTHISPIDGDRCPMTPSCSAYAQRAIQKHGPLTGWIMAMDRLVRCGRDEKHLAPRVMIQGVPHIYDPVENNDFWWKP